MVEDPTASLAWRLGIREGHRVGLVNAPGTFIALARPLPPGAELLPGVRSRRDVVVAFLRERGELESKLDAMVRAIAPDGALWIMWPSRPSTASTALTAAIVRDVASRMSLADGDRLAVDDTWAGLRLVVRGEPSR